MTGLDDIRLKETIDLEERAHYLREELLPDLEERIEYAEEKLSDADSDDPEQSPQDLRNLRDRLEGQARACDRVVNALNGGEFTIQELLASETSLLQDDVTEHSVDVDYEREEVSGAPKEGYHKIRTLQLSIVGWPDAVDSSDIERDRDIGRKVFRVGKLPSHVTDYLYKCAVNLNDAGEVEGVGKNLSDYGVRIEP